MPMIKWVISKYLFLIAAIFLLSSCQAKKVDTNSVLDIEEDTLTIEELVEDRAIEKPKEYFKVEQKVIVKDYFQWMANVLDSLNSDRNYEIDEYALVQSNKWIIDTLRNTDYYYLKGKGILSKDPTAHTIVESGTMLLVPDSMEVVNIWKKLNEVYIDLNIPEYQMRIKQGDSILYQFTARVGRNESRFLAMAGREISLRTMPGTGTIVRINRNPTFINPKDNKRYKVTRRDDQVVTALPNIPWIEPEINGIRYGHLIHPTTNLETLGKASSNGCIGLRESDAWTVYFYAPLGTEIVIRYDLEVKNEADSVITLKNIYPGFEKKKVERKLRPALASITDIQDDGTPVCYCGKVD